SASRRVPRLHVVGPGAASTSRRDCREACGAGLRRVLRQPAARRAALGLGLGAERNRALPADAGEGARRDAPAPRRASAAPAALGRLPRRPAVDRVLAGTRRPAARPLALYPQGRRVERRAACTLTSPGS